ncbi:COG3932 Uncharacterized ABC-type transport system, permease components [Rhabdaerophilaceae bacterium]
MRIHEILSGLVSAGAGEKALGSHPAISDIVSALGPRSFGLVLVLFGLPNLLPVPGLPILCGFIIGLIAVQMVLGKPYLALPAWVGKRRLKRDDLDKVVKRATPTLRAIERMMRVRLDFLTSPAMYRVLGVVLGILAIALMAPIPFFGGIAPGIAVVLIGLGLTARDGLFILAGGVASVFAVVLTGLITLAILKSIAFLVI